MLILNLAAGKLKPILKDEEEGPHVLVNLDTSYYSHHEPDLIESSVAVWFNQGRKENLEYYCNRDAFEFMERTSLIFDRVCVYRFLEHIPLDRVLYFIYLLSTVVKKDGLVDIIVPNYMTLADMILNENVNDPDFEAHNILLTTELVNEPGCPHASIWTRDRAGKFFELEGRFGVVEVDENYVFDGRDIYLRFLAKRIK